MARKLKFGSPAWRKKYMKKNRPKRKRANAPKGPRIWSRIRGKARKARKAKAATKRLNKPTKGWVKATAYRVVRRNGEKIVEIKR